MRPVVTIQRVAILAKRLVQLRLIALSKIFILCINTFTHESPLALLEWDEHRLYCGGQRNITAASCRSHQHGRCTCICPKPALHLLYAILNVVCILKLSWLVLHPTQLLPRALDFFTCRHAHSLVCTIYWRINHRQSVIAFSIELVFPGRSPQRLVKVLQCKANSLWRINAE